MSIEVQSIEAADRMIEGTGSSTQRRDPPSSMDVAHYLIVLLGITGLYVGLGTAIYGLTHSSESSGLVQIGVGLGAALLSISVSRWSANRIERRPRAQKA